MSALALAGFYLGLARVFWSRTVAKQRFLAESSLALGVGFGTLAIPLAWDAHWTSASWAVEGAALVWAGVRTRRALARGFGVALQLAAGVAFLWGLDATAAHLALADSLVLGSAFIRALGAVLRLAPRATVRRAHLSRRLRVAGAPDVGHRVVGGGRTTSSSTPTCAPSCGPRSPSGSRSARARR